MSIPMTTVHSSTARWPELRDVFADDRAESHWEWDEVTQRYREILPPGTSREVSRS